jgi:hypothetical protein
LLLAHIALRKAGPSTDPEGERAQRAEPNETRASDEAASTRMA